MKHMMRKLRQLNNGELAPDLCWLKSAMQRFFLALALGLATGCGNSGSIVQKEATTSKLTECSFETFEALALLQASQVGVAASRKEVAESLRMFAQDIVNAHGPDLTCKYSVRVLEQVGPLAPVKFGRYFNAAVGPGDVCVNSRGQNDPDNADFWNVYPWHWEEEADLTGIVRQVRVFDDICIARS